MILVTNMARAALIVAVATSMGMFGRDLHEFLTEDVKGLITHVVTGRDEKPEAQIDKCRLDAGGAVQHRWHQDSQ